MREYLEIMEDISIQNSWPFYLVIYALGLVITIVAIRKNKRKKAEKDRLENQEIEDMTN